MPNLLSIPCKKTYVAPIRQTVRDYISTHHLDTHPDAFKWDISRWEALRKDGVGDVVHVDRIKSSLRYHAQLVFILTKLPVDIGLEIAYAPVFIAGALPTTLRNLIFERAGVLFNLAAMYSQLAAAEDRSNAQGLKQMIAYYQAAAGTLKYLNDTVTPTLRASVTEDDMPLDLSDAFLSSLEALMLAQGQEGVWQRAVIDNYKNGVIAKLAAKVASLYAAALRMVKEAPFSIKHLFPSGWLAHIETKQLHFEGAAQYRKSVDDLEARRYGHEIARLTLAQTTVKRGHDLARKGGVNPAVLQDIKSLLDTVQKDLARAERDNDLIYHHEVLPASSLPPIVEVSMVQPLISSALTEPKTALENDAVIFGELLGYGAKVAIDIYNNRRQVWIQEQIIDRAQRLDDEAVSVLRSLNLPAALEALEKPIGLPPSLLKKAEEVRTADGPAKIEASIENVHKLAQRNMDLLNEAMDVLDQEAEEDEVFQEESPSTRQPSHEANVELVSKAQRYKQILDEASQSDAVVRTKWEEWEQNITELTWSEADLEAAVPSTTLSLASSRSSGKGVNPTQTHGRHLRVLLETLDDLKRSRAQLVSRVERLAESEDITPRILKAAAAIERWVEVQPSMFEDVLDQEMAKFDKFKYDIEEGEQKQEATLKSIKERNALFIGSRKEDASVKEREHSLQSLDLAYHKYKEITRNLDEGLKFYNDIGSILIQFRETCKGWANHRQEEMRSIMLDFQKLSLQGHEHPSEVPESHSRPDVVPPSHQPQTKVPRPTSQQSSHSRATSNPKPFLPPPGSHEWEAIVLPPAPNKRNAS